MQAGQVDEELLNRDGDKVMAEDDMEEGDYYKEPSQPVDDETHIRGGGGSIGEVLRENFEDKARKIARENEEFTNSLEEITEFLEKKERTWILTGSLGSEVYARFIENTTGNNKNPEPSDLLEKCEELNESEKKMCEYESCLCGQMEHNEHTLEMLGKLEDFKTRCSALKEVVVHARRFIMDCSSSIGLMGGNADYCIRDEQFKSDLHSTNMWVPPVGYPLVNDDLIEEYTKVLENFVKKIGTDLNGNKKEDMWKIKADEVEKLEISFREKLALDKTSFCFLEEEKVTDHEVVWKIGGEIKVIKWAKLLKGSGKGRGDSLGVIPKDRQFFKDLLIKIG